MNNVTANRISNRLVSPQGGFESHNSNIEDINILRLITEQSLEWRSLHVYPGVEQDTEASVCRYNCVYSGARRSAEHGSEDDSCGDWLS